MKYVYSVIRFVPDLVRGEFVNVGILAGSEESSEWDIRSVGNLRRARYIDDVGLLHQVWGFVEDMGREVARYTRAVETGRFDSACEQLSEEWLKRLSEESRNVVQFSTPAVIVAENVDEALDILFKQFIVEPETRQFTFKKKYEALAAIRRAYREAGLKRQEHFEERANVKGEHHKERFDFVVANGRAVQLAQTWSFQVPNQDDLAKRVKAWAWTVGDIRQHGGTAELGARHIDVPHNVDIEVVYVPPANGGPRETLDEALAAFEDINVQAMEADQANVVGLQASRLVGI